MGGGGTKTKHKKTRREELASRLTEEQRVEQVIEVGDWPICGLAGKELAPDTSFLQV